MNKPSTNELQFASDDEDLVRRAQAGDDAGFEQVYHRYHRQALGLAARICGPEEAEDATQAAFISAWQSLGSYRRERASVKTWLMSIVRHRAIDTIRKRGGVAMSSLDSAPEEEDPVRTESLVVQREESSAVRRAVAGLPDDQRQVLELAYFNELSQSEIARTLKLPLGTVKGRARLGMQKLPARLAGSPTAPH